MTSEELARQLRLFLIRAEKGTALLVNYEWEQLLKEVQQYLDDHPLEDRTQIDAILGQIEKQLRTRIIRFSSAVSLAQKRVIRSTANALKQQFAQLNPSIFDPDKEAIAKLIGRTQHGGSLTKAFQRLEQPVREKVRAELIEGFSLGESSQRIASRLDRVADFGKVRSLTIARTETNEAYRAATRDFYQDAAIQKYVWMAVLDPRTCVICWSLHGRVFNSSRKVFSHPNCRCTMIAVGKGMTAVETGAERFIKLMPGFQKQILGPKRFELFNSGSELSSFVGSAESKEFGLKHFIKPLESLQE
jgi:SPP1 gp7 family putative phage head morphogenesis protein